MLSRPSNEILQRFASFAEALNAPASSTPPLKAGQKPSKELPTFRFGQRLIILASAPSASKSQELAQWLKANRPEAFADGSAYEIIVAIAGAAWVTDFVIDRGIKLMSVHSALAEVIGLPSGWRDGQMEWLRKTLEPLRMDGAERVAGLRATDGPEQREATPFVSEWLSSWNAKRSEILYLRAEAGKGKSTLLAYGVRQGLDAGIGPLPLYVPLRTLQRGMGISWGEITSRLGVLGSGADPLKEAVRSGVVALALDGLDEVAGRYDPTTVQAVIAIVLSDLQTDSSNIVLSGRTTEAALFAPGRARLVGIDLPEPDDPAFRDYASIVVRHTVPQWPGLAPRIPEPPVAPRDLRADPPDEGELARISHWIERVFVDLGKERSLFFVQSLACIARSYQLSGNQALVIETAGAIRIKNAPLYDVCLLAAALACVREQDKVESLAKDLFTPERQLELLTCLALRASAGEDVRRQLRTPQELATRIFDVDPTHQNEEFTAILRQMQKHALLFAGSDDGARAGDWRPQFLSEWVRAALLCRAWQRAERMPEGTLEPMPVG